MKVIGLLFFSVGLLSYLFNFSHIDVNKQMLFLGQFLGFNFILLIGVILIIFSILTTNKSNEKSKLIQLYLGVIISIVGLSVFFEKDKFKLDEQINILKQLYNYQNIFILLGFIIMLFSTQKKGQ